MSETSKYKELEPEKKKQKIETSDDDPSEEDEKKKKKVDRTKAGDAMFELSDKRKCFVRKWRNGILVDVREVYMKGGELCPGKKGISLTLDQYKTFRQLVLDGDIDDEIKALGGDLN